MMTRSTGSGTVVADMGKMTSLDGRFIVLRRQNLPTFQQKSRASEFFRPMIHYFCYGTKYAFFDLRIILVLETPWLTDSTMRSIFSSEP